MKPTTSLKRIMELKIGVAALSLFAVGVLSCAALGAQRPGTARMKGDRQRAVEPTDAQEFDSCLTSCTGDGSTCLVACLALSGETDQSVINATGPMPPVPFMQDRTADCVTLATSNVQSCANLMLADDVGGSKQAFWVCAGGAASRFLACSRVESLANDDEGDAARYGLGLVLRLAKLAATPDGFFDGVRNTRTALAPQIADTDDTSGTIAATTPLLSDECFETCSSNLKTNLASCDGLSGDPKDACIAAAIRRFNACVDACINNPAE